MVSKNFEPPTLSPIRTLRTGTEEPFLAIRAYEGRVVAVTEARVYEWAAEQDAPVRVHEQWTYEVMPGRVETMRLGEMKRAAISPRLDRIAAVKHGGSKLSGDFSSLRLHRLNDAGLGAPEEDDIPLCRSLGFSPNGKLLAFECGRGAAGIFRVEDFSARRRYPALPPHGNTLGERLAAENAAPKAKIATLGCANDAFYMFQAQKTLRVATEGDEAPAEWPIKAIESCVVFDDGSFVTVDRHKKIQRWDSHGQPVWEAKKARALRVIAGAPDGSFVLTEWGLFSGAAGELTALVRSEAGVATFADKVLYVGMAGVIVAYTVA